MRSRRSASRVSPQALHGSRWCPGSAARQQRYEALWQQGAISHLGSGSPSVLSNMIVSVNHRHARGHRFPAAVDDDLAALQWVGDHRKQLGGAAGGLAVCGWSAGANIAAVTGQRARDLGGPAISRACRRR